MVSTALDLTGCTLIHVPIVNAEDDIIKAWGMELSNTVGYLFNVQHYKVSMYQKQKLQHRELLSSFMQGISQFEDSNSGANQNQTLPGVAMEKQPVGGHWWTIGKV